MAVQFRPQCFQFDRPREVNGLVKRFHYSHRPIPVARVLLSVSFHAVVDGDEVFPEFGPASAGCLFAYSPGRWPEQVVELIRLVRSEDYNGPPLSQLVSVAVRELKRRGVDLIISYADKTQRHHGGIYQACSWNYSGKRKKRIDGLFVHGQFVPARTCNKQYGSSSPDKVREKFGGRIKVEEHFDRGKYLYWKALNNQGIERAARLGLKIKPYPKPKK